MQGCCNLQVDVNGEEVFMVDKKKLASFCGRFNKLFGCLMDHDTNNLKLVFNDFPGGAKGFELVARFCYNNGKTEITPATVGLLNCAAQFMEMENDGSRPSLLNQTKRSLDGVGFWTWSDLLLALKECQDLQPASSSSVILDRILVSVVGRLVSPFVGSSYTSSSENSSFQCSSDTRSSHSTRCNFSQLSWWFEDLLFLNIDMIEKVIRMMISQNFDHGTISKFLFCYQRSRFLSSTPTHDRIRIAEVIINLLSLLDRSFLSCKLLFEMFRVASRLKVSKYCKSVLENLISSQLDRATIDFLLIPSPRRKRYLYDVNFVLRLVKAFCSEGRCLSSATQLRKVACLVDSYLMEVAADSHLEPSKFASLVMLLPDFARESHDSLFQAMDIYLEVHFGLHEEDRMRICSAVNYAKLSTDALRHLARNSKFPSRIAIQAFLNQQSKFESFVEHKRNDGSSSGSLSTYQSINKKENSDQIILFQKRVNLPRKAEQPEVELQGIQCRITDLEKLSGIMQTRIGNIPRTRLSSLGNNAKFLPKLCS